MKFLPALGRVSRAVHVIPAIAIVNPGVLLHHIILIVIPVLANLSPRVSRNNRGVILKLEIDIHISGNAVYRASVCGLPDRRTVISIHHIVPGNPHIIIEGIPVNFIVQPVLVGINHGMIAGILNLFAERIDNLADLLRWKCTQRSRILRIEGNRVGNRIVLHQLQNKISLLLRHLHAGGVGVDIGSQLHTGCIGCVCIFPEIGIYLSLVSGSQHNEIHIVSSYLVPVHILLPVRYVNSSSEYACDRGAVRHLIHISGALPGSRISRQRLKPHRGSQNPGHRQSRER